ncbi:MAG: hypothetical protein ACLFQX_06640 [Candidatus Kapaibacterium sp.]
MFWEFIFALVIGFALTALFATGFRRRTYWPGFFTFFFIIFLAAWAGGLWLRPVGPEWFGVFWIPFIAVGLLFALLLLALLPPRYRRGLPREESAETEAEKTGESLLGIFFWIFIIAMIIAIIAGYWTRPMV